MKNYFKKGISIILSVILLLSITYIENNINPKFISAGYIDIVPAGFTGIYDVNDLNSIRENLSGNYILMTDLNLGNDTTVNGEFYNEGNGWEPIGTSDEPFTGIFDGNGFIISDVYITPKNIENNYFIGLFGVNSGEIKNLGCNSFTFSPVAGNFDISLTMYGYIGSIAGVNKGIVSDCFITGEINLSFENQNISYHFYSPKLYFGGLVGLNDSGIIERSFFSGHISYLVSDWQQYIGGIASQNINGGIIRNCYNSGNMVVNEGYIYGIAGESSGTIEFCYNAGLLSSVSYISHPFSIRNNFVNNCTYFDKRSEETKIDEEIMLVAATFEDMQSENSFVDFDFTDTWMFDQSTGFPFPQLKSNPHREINNQNDFSEGNGTVFNPYVIKNAIEFNKIRNYTATAFILGNDINLTDLPANQNGTNWEPVGSNKLPFVGILDGNGYTITGLSINETEKSYQGLIHTNKGVIKNLTLSDGYIYADNNVAAFVVNNYGRILNCKNEMQLSGKSIGGIVCNHISGIIKNCVNTTDIYLQLEKRYYVYIGGIAGRQTGFESKIIECTNSGNITVIDNFVSRVDVGGITSKGNVYNSFNSGNISCTGVSEYIKAAGITGSAGIVSHSYNTGNVTAINRSKSGRVYAGGIFGGDNDRMKIGTISNSYNTGTIVAASNYESYAGGIAGLLNSDDPIGADNCYNTGKVTSTSLGNKSAESKIFSTGIMLKIGASNRIISNSYNVGEVITDGTGYILGNSNNNNIYINDRFVYEGLLLNGKGKTREEMLLQSTYEGFDFDNHWEMPEDGYPLLRGLPYVKLDGFEFANQEINIISGEIVTDIYQFLNEDASNKSVYLKSMDSNIAQIDFLGRIVGRMAGTTIIKASSVDGNFESEMIVNVTPAPKIESIKMDIPSLEIIKSNTAQLKIMYTPEDTLDNKQAIWSSSDSNIASVNQDGLVTAIGGGDAVITATIGELSTTSKIKVIVPMKSILLTPSRIDIIRGENAKLKLEIFPGDTTDSRYTIWSSSDPNIATVSSGVVYAKSKGQAIITVKVGNFTQTCIVNVIVPLYSIILNKTEMTLNIGKSETLKVGYLPPDPTKKPELYWSSSNHLVASVYAYSGNVTAVGPGTAIITVSGDGYKATCTVYVPLHLESISLSKSTLNMRIGQNEKLNVILNPAKATDAPDFIWSSSNNSVVAVSKDGNLTAKGNGTSTITVVGGNYSATCKVTVDSRIGDINGDGIVDVTDILRLRAHILGKSKLTGNALLAGDVNNDGLINVTDILLIRSLILKS